MQLYPLQRKNTQDYTLSYLRNKDGQEVDFALVNQDKIETIIEVKFSDHSISKSILKFHEKYNYPSIQLVKSLRNEYTDQGISVLKAEKFLAQLFL